MKLPVTILESGECRVNLPKDLVKKIPCVSRSNDGWACFYWMDLLEVAKHFEITLTDESTEIFGQLKESRKSAIGNKDVEAEGVSELFSEAKKPRKFQLKAINFALSQKNVLIADDVGLGKTIIAIGVLLKAIENEEIDGAIILCPSSVKYQWKHEMIAANEYLPDIERQIAVIDGDRAERTMQYADNPTFAILNYHLLLRDADRIADMMVNRSLAVVADECSSDGAIKTRSSKTAKAFKKLFGNAPYKLALTATPVENRLHDLYSVMEWIEPLALGPYKHFEDKYLVLIHLKIKRKTKYGKEYIIMVPKVINHKNLDDARWRLEDRFIRRTAKEVGEEMPKATSVVYTVELSSEARERYNKIADELRGQTQLVGKIVPLRRCCAAPCLVGGEGEDSGKVAELIRLLETELFDETCIIVTQWREKWIDILKRKLKKWKPLVIHGGVSQEDRERTRESFMGGQSKLLLMTEVGGYGLNLQCASVLVNLDLNWNPAKIWQRIGRIYRIGSKHDKIRIISLVAGDTIEEKVLRVLSSKQDLFSQLFATDGLEKLTDAVSGWSDNDIRRMI